MKVMRTKLSFVLLKSVLVSLRGARGKKGKLPITPIAYTSFNLVPEGLSKESLYPQRLSDM